MQAFRTLTAVILLFTTSSLLHADDFEWNRRLGGYFHEDNWNPVGIPGSGDIAFIRNGGSCWAFGGLFGNPTAILLTRMTVGDEVGNGKFEAFSVDLATDETFEVGSIRNENAPTSGTVYGISGTARIEHAASLVVGSRLSVGMPRADGADFVSSRGDLTIQKVTDVFIDGDVEVGSAITNEGSTVVGTGKLTVRDVDTFTIESDLDSPDAGTGSTDTAAIRNADVLFEKIGLLDISGDFDVAQNSDDETNTFESGVVKIVFRHVDTLISGGDFDFNRGNAGPGGLKSSIVKITFDHVNATFDSRVSIVRYNVTDDGVSKSQATFKLIDSTLMLQDDGVFDEGFNIATLLGGGTNPDTDQSATVDMKNSIVTAAMLSIGTRLDNTAGKQSGVLKLSHGSLFDCDQLNLGEDGKIAFQLKRLNNHPVIEAAAGVLDGRVDVDFHFFPPLGTHTFDLIVSDAPGALQTLSPVFTAHPPLGFIVEFFGVTQNNLGNDVLRLTIRSLLF